jgi:hypothetical protein
MVQATTHNQSTLRQLKWLVVLLILSNVALGVFGFSVLRSIDRRYSDLIVQSVPLLNNLQTLTAQSVEAMRATGSNLLDVPVAARDDAIRHGRQVLVQERTFRAQLVKQLQVVGVNQGRQKIQAAGEAFTTLATQVLEVAASGKFDDAKRLRDEKLRPAFDQYLVAITKGADDVEATSLRTNDDYSARTGSMSHVLLGVASWPVLVIVGLLLFTAVFVLGLMILFRGREMNDMP